MVDLHPDRFYEVYSSTSEDAACHSGQGPAGIYGAETSECDSPIALINKTMEWVAKELKDEIDFVIWTGDSARHDNDDDYPRSDDQVLSLNRFTVHKMFEVFGKNNGDEKDDDPNNDYIVPIIPTFGNNDILPHNILEKGPNRWTRTYAAIWRHFIPEVQKHQFEQGGWFYVEVIPNKLAVFSLNTLYFFDSNAAADGCAAPAEPGYRQLEWLRIQLQFMRERGVKAIMTGHVPPIRQEAKTSWDETCWQKYTLWLQQYRDVIVGSIYGHFNFDHFVLQDFGDLDEDTKNGRMSDYDSDTLDGGDSDDEFSTLVSPNYFKELRDEWSDLPQPPKAKSWMHSIRDELTWKKKGKKKNKKQKKYLKKMGGEYAERFATSFISASVVPNLFPTLRVFEYNITGLENVELDSRPTSGPAAFDINKDIEPHLMKAKKYKFTVPDAPSRSAPPGPAYSPQTLSFLKYTQYFANITHINNDFTSSSEDADDLDSTKWKAGKHKGKKPHSKDHTPSPKKFQYNILYETRDDKVYHLDDLTMPNLVDLARRVGEFVPLDELDVADEECQHPGDLDAEKNKKKKKKHKKKEKQREKNKAWFTFIRRAYVDTMNREEIEDEFGG